MMKTLFLSTAIAALAATGPLHAQESGQQSQQAQAGQGDQRIAQEVARAQGTELYVSPAGTRLVQQAFNQAGYDAGNVDGQWNDQTSSAAANYQQANGLEPTGNLNVSTIRALGLQDILSGQGEGGQQAAAGQTGSATGGEQRIAQEEAQGGGTMLYVSPAGVRQIKQALNERSYDAGVVSGEWNDQAVQAAVNFQQAQGFEPTGVIDLGLISALGVGQQVFAGGQGGQMAQADDQQLAQEEAAQGSPLYLGPAGVRQVTQALNQAGYQAGNVDAEWGENTRQAVMNYQQAQGLEPTGTLTMQFLSAVGMGGWMQSTMSGAGGGVAQQGGGTAGTIENEATGSIDATGGSTTGGSASGGSATGGNDGAVITVPVE